MKKEHREGETRARSVVHANNRTETWSNYTHQSYHPVDLQASLSHGRSLLARGCQFLFPVFHVHVLE